MSREEIKAFFKDCIVNGITRDVVFPEFSERGRIEIELVAPPQAGMDTIYLSFPADKVEE